MKPDWKTAPEWAQYCAMDEDGVWWWYEDRPIISTIECWKWSVSGYGRVAEVEHKEPNWRKSLEERPKLDEDDDILEHIDTILRGMPYKPCGGQKTADKIVDDCEYGLMA